MRPRPTPLTPTQPASRPHLLPAPASLPLLLVCMTSDLFRREMRLGSGPEPGRRGRRLALDG